MSLIPKACFFTGHRKISPNELTIIKSRLQNAIKSAIDDGVSVFISGGAIGFDTIAAEQVIELKKDYDIRLCMYLPCINQQMLWNEGERIRFDSICAYADEIYYVTREPYKDGCMKKRNRAMTEASDMCIAYMKNPHSGTAQTLKMAEEKGIKIINITNR